MKPFFNWIENNFQEKRPISSFTVDGAIFQPGRITNAFAADTLINNIQYAAASRVCVKFTYHDKIRTVEPLRIEKSKANNLILLSHERESSQPKRFSLSEISKIEVTNSPYEERE